MFGRKKIAAVPAQIPEEDRSQTLYAADDLMTRAEKLVWMMGWRGSGIGGRIIDVYRFLQVYEKLDRERDGLPPIPAPHLRAVND